MGAFPYHRFIFLLACIDHWKVYNRLIPMCTAKTAIEVERQFVLTSKNVTFVGLPCFSPLFCLCAPQVIGQIQRLKRLS